MNLILNIDTSLEHAFVCISQNGIPVDTIENHQQKEHATFLHTAIKTLTEKLSIDLKELSAIAVTAGPGSYTGLRVGMATAKGLCYALNKPLITVGTLEMIAKTAILRNDMVKHPRELFCPMIDARRMEVFYALYDQQLNELIKPAALILDQNTLSDFLMENYICFTGSGSEKFEKILTNQHASFLKTDGHHFSLSALSDEYHDKKKYAELSQIEPIYVKEYQTFNT